MKNTEKRLEEFGEKFGSDLDYIYQIKDVKSFLTESINQALAEDRERMREKTKGVRDSLLVYFHNAVNDQKAPYRHAIQAIEEEILSSLDTNPK